LEYWLSVATIGAGVSLGFGFGYFNEGSNAFIVIKTLESRVTGHVCFSSDSDRVAQFQIVGLAVPALWKAVLWSICSQTRATQNGVSQLRAAEVG
jgi:hypothetical protein